MLAYLRAVARNLLQNVTPGIALEDFHALRRGDLKEVVVSHRVTY